MNDDKELVPDAVVYNGMLVPITYDAIRAAMNGKPYQMSLTGRDEIASVIAAVNQGIDSHLEACFCPERGDRYEHSVRKCGDIAVCRTLDCVVSVESLPVLLRRLTEVSAVDDEQSDAGESLAWAILETLGFDDYGVHHDERD